MANDFRCFKVGFISLAFLGWLAHAPADQPTGAEKLPCPIAHWSFDDATSPWQDSGMRAWHGHVIYGTDFSSAPGVWGKAQQFAGKHRVEVPNDSIWGQLRQLTISAWVVPTDLSTYREIFRKEDGDNRVLFSFQNDGRYLSLGLNIGGYVECDAPIQPEQVLDGRWHHCAATFDGTWIRVYLDGVKIGELNRAGSLTAGGGAAPCIGSLNGEENFQGKMDELVIFDVALSEETIKDLYREGFYGLLKQQDSWEELLALTVSHRGSFPKMLTAARSHVLSRQGQARLDHAWALSRLIQIEFPEASRVFSQHARFRLEDYLLREDLGEVRALAKHLCDLYLEYCPLTPEQWARLSPAERDFWNDRQQQAQRYFELERKNEPASSPAWIDWIVTVGPQIAYRPSIYEAVAPYVPAQTPETRRLSAEAARAILQEDWLFQADGKADVARVRQEITWTRQLIHRIEQDPRAPDFSAELGALKEIEQRLPLEGDVTPVYFLVREIKRRVMFKNPAIDFDTLMFIDQPYPQGSEWQHETRHRLGYMAVPGGRLLLLRGLSPDGDIRQLAPQLPLHGSFWRFDLSYDAKRAVFCFKPHNEKSFHLYEIDLEGGQIRQLTWGPYDDLDPIYSPDERHIIFTTTRGHTYVRCMPPTNAFVLARCERDGSNIYLISANNEPDYLPSFMPDGRVLYTRWEYTDKPVWRAQGLWTVRPDGTQVQVFWGNQSVWPDLLKDARVIPGSRRVLFTGSAHHDWFSGCLGIIDPDRGFNYPDGLTKITMELPWPESGPAPRDTPESPTYHVSGRYDAYYSPYPLTEKDFLVSARRGGKFRLYLMDTDGNRELIYEGAHNIWYAQPVKPRPRPLVIPDSVAWPTLATRHSPLPGVIYSTNVYQNAPAVLAGKAKYLRVWTIDHKTYTYWYQRPYISTGPVVSVVQSDGVKRLLGIVPIEDDGSVAFEAPSGIPLHFQLLDERQRALQTMRSFVHVMPGEQRGCLGCHESHSRTPPLAGDFLTQRMTVRTITPPPWDDTTVSYPRYVQPVLEKYCGECHMGQGEAVKVLDLTPRPGFLGFAEPYFLLTGRPTWGQPYVKPPVVPPGFGFAGMLVVEGYDRRDPAGYRTPPPMTALSYRSPLVELCSSGQHYGVKLDELSLLRLITWIDAMCPYRGEEEIREIPDPDFQGIDWLAIRPRIRTAPKIIRPGPMDIPPE